MNIELRALATMLDRQDFGPIQRGDLTLDHMVTTDGATLLNFILQYRHTTSGAARFPSLSTVLERFAATGIEIPEPEARNVELGGLIYETRLQKVRGDLRAYSTLLDQLSMSPDPMESLPTLLKDLRHTSEEVSRAKHESLASSIVDILMEYDAGNLLCNGIPWPWPSMQGPTKGLQRKEFVCIAGRPKSRKTFVALCIAAVAFLVFNARVLFVSPEMPARVILMRFIAFLAKARYTEFKNSSLDEAEFERIVDLAALYGQAHGENDDAFNFRLHETLCLPDGTLGPSFDVVQGTNKTVSWVESQIEIFQPDLVIVDSFYRLKSEGGRARDADWKQVTAISRALKDMCMESNIALIGTHQMNRDAEGKIGSTGNLALADAVGQDADLILRVITGKQDGIDTSALVVLGGRELPFDGIMIHNQPCFDFEEIGPIVNKSTVMKLMASEDEEDANEEAKKLRAKKRVKTKDAGARNAALEKTLMKSAGKLGDGNLNIDGDS